MEKDRTVIAIVISLLVILVYFQFFGPKQQPRPPQPQPQKTVTKDEAKEVVQPTPPAEPEKTEEPEPIAPVEEPPVPEEEGTFSTDIFEVKWSNSSGAVEEIVLNAKKEGKYLYPDYTRENPLRLIYSEDGGDYALRLCKPSSVEDIAAGNWEVIEKSDHNIVMQTRIPGGPTITKEIISPR